MLGDVVCSGDELVLGEAIEAAGGDVEGGDEVFIFDGLRPCVGGVGGGEQDLLECFCLFVFLGGDAFCGAILCNYYGFEFGEGGIEVGYLCGEGGIGIKDWAIFYKEAVYGFYHIHSGVLKVLHVREVVCFLYINM